MIERQIVGPTATIRDAMQILNAAPVKLVVAVDGEGRLVRTIVDGDLRRALLAEATLDACVTCLPAGSPVAYPQGTDDADLARALSFQDNINAIVIVDDQRRPVEVKDRASLQLNISLSPPHIGTAEAGYVQQAFDDNWVAPAGPNLRAFEGALQQVSGRAHALALSSGTAALHLALRVLGVEAGKRVYVSDLTFAASLQPILYLNATPVLIDSEPVTWNMSPEALERRLDKDAANGDLPAAIIVVHLYGQSANMSAIMALAAARGVPVIEDAAESLGATYMNQPSGAHGLMSVYSFNGNKIITTSGGGALVSDREDLMAKARMLSTQGRDAAEHYQHSEIAYNYRMSNVLAGIGLGQIELLQDRVERRRATFNRYRSELGTIEGLSFQEEAPGSRGNRWLTVITLDPDHFARHPYQLMRKLREHGIESRPAWKPMHMQPLCAGFDLEPHSGMEIVSSRLFIQSLCLPSGSSLTEAEQDRIIRVVQQFAKG